MRTVYLPIIRSGPQAGPAELRNVFDFTQPGEFAGRRAVTTVPTQALLPDECRRPEAAGRSTSPGGSWPSRATTRGSIASGSAC